MGEKVQSNKKKTEAVNKQAANMNVEPGPDLIIVQPTTLLGQRKLLTDKRIDSQQRQRLALRISRVHGNRHLQNVLFGHQSMVSKNNLPEQLNRDIRSQNESNAEGKTSLVQKKDVEFWKRHRKLRKRRKLLLPRVRELVLKLGTDPKAFGRLNKLLRKARVRPLERQYTILYGKANLYDTKHDLNPYQLRDDIRDNGKKNRSVSGSMLRYLQRSNRLPRQVLRTVADKKRAEAAWPEKVRNFSEQRLAKPASWPGNYGSRSSKIQGWGEWVFTNYFYLRNPSNAATHELRIQFNWPKASELPRSKGDKTRTGDLAFFANLANQFDQAWGGRLRIMSQEALYAAHKHTRKERSTKAALIKYLKQWKEVFTKTSGKMADFMLKGIKKRLKKAKKGKFQ